MQIDHRHLTKEDPDIGMLVVKVRFTIHSSRLHQSAAHSSFSGLMNLLFLIAQLCMQCKM